MREVHLRRRDIIWLTLAAILLTTVAFYAGRWQARAARAQHEQEQQAAGEALAAAQTQLAESESLARLLDARGLVYRAAVELDNRNFGTANQHLTAAAQLVGAVRSLPQGLDSEALRALQAQLAGADLNVAANLQQQRQQLLALAAHMDSLLASHLPRRTN